MRHLTPLLLISLFFITSCTTTTPAIDTTQGIRIGAEKAALRMDIYYDLSCTHCRAFFQNYWPTLYSKYVSSDKLQVFFHDFPTGTSPLPPHYAAYCAHAEGKFLPFLEQAYQVQQPLKDAVLKNIGTSIGLGQTFTTCIDQHTYAQTVEKQKTEGLQRNVGETPLLIIGNERFNSTSTLDDIERALSAQIPESQQPQ